MIETEYYIVGVVPVKVVHPASGGLAVLKMNRDTGVFERDLEYLLRVRHDKDDVKAVSHDQFIQHVEAIRARRLSGEGDVFAVYKFMNALEDVAKEEGRELTPYEERLLAELRRETYALFQLMHPDPDYEASGEWLNPAEAALDQALLIKLRALYDEALAKGVKTP